MLVQTKSTCQPDATLTPIHSSTRFVSTSLIRIYDIKSCFRYENFRCFKIAAKFCDCWQHKSFGLLRQLQVCFKLFVLQGYTEVSAHLHTLILLRSTDQTRIKKAIVWRLWPKVDIMNLQLRPQIRFLSYVHNITNIVLLYSTIYFYIII